MNLSTKNANARRFKRKPILNRTSQTKDHIQLYEPYIDGHENLNQIKRKRDLSKETNNKEFNSTTHHDWIWRQRVFTSYSLRRKKAIEKRNFRIINHNPIAIKIDNMGDAMSATTHDKYFVEEETPKYQLQMGGKEF